MHAWKHNYILNFMIESALVVATHAVTFGDLSLFVLKNGQFVSWLGSMYMYMSEFIP